MEGVFPGAYGIDTAPATFGEYSLREGEIVDVYDPEHPRNYSKTTTEYIVELQFRSGFTSPGSRSVRAVLADNFGGIADFSSFSLRKRTNKVTRNSPETDGARVLVLCLNGDESHGVIIAGLKNTNVKNFPEIKDIAGRFKNWVFNGVSAFINDSGELKISAAGATKNDGTPDERNEDNHGPYVKFTKNGNLYVTDNNGQSIELKSKQKSIHILAQESAQVNAKKIWLGAESANENLVLGQQLVVAMGELLMLFIKNSNQIGANSGGPVILNPQIATGLIQWKRKWVTATNTPAKILSNKSFTER